MLAIVIKYITECQNYLQCTHLHSFCCKAYAVQWYLKSLKFCCNYEWEAPMYSLYKPGSFPRQKRLAGRCGSDVTDKSSPSSADQPGEPSLNRFLGLPSLKSSLGVNTARADIALKGQ